MNEVVILVVFLTSSLKLGEDILCHVMCYISDKIIFADLLHFWDGHSIIAAMKAL